MLKTASPITTFAIFIHESPTRSYAQTPSHLHRHPLFPMLIPFENAVGPPPTFAFCVQVFFAGSYSQKSSVEPAESAPAPKYPLLPMLNAVAPALAVPPKFAF